MAGFGHLGSLVDDINKRDAERLKLESQLRQQRMRADAEEAKASQLKGEVEVASADRVSLQQEIGLLSRRNEDLIAEKAKLSEQSSDFQRSMFNNEAKLKENERDLKKAQRSFVDSLEKSNASYSSHRAVMKTLVGRNGVGCAEIPSPEELEAFRGASARAAELQARLHAVEAESQALKQEAAASSRKQQILQREIDSLKRNGTGGNSSAGSPRVHKESGKNKQQTHQQRKQQQQLQQQQRQQQHITALENEIARLEDTCNRQMEYMSQLEEYANRVEAVNEDLRREQGARLDNGGRGVEGGQQEGGGGRVVDKVDDDHGSMRFVQGGEGSDGQGQDNNDVMPSAEQGCANAPPAVAATAAVTPQSRSPPGFRSPGMR